jgi:hypothetical protein
MRFEHIVVCPFDPKLDYEEICNGLFQGRYLAVIEKPKGKETSPNIHIQGETELAVTTFEDKVANLITKKHYKRELPELAHCRPCKRMKPDVAEKGFVMPAKGEAPLVSGGLSAGELTGLRKEEPEASVEAEPKMDIATYLLEMAKKQDSITLFKKYQDVVAHIKNGYFEPVYSKNYKLQPSNRVKTIVWGIALKFITPASPMYKEFRAKMADQY